MVRMLRLQCLLSGENKRWWQILLQWKVARLKIFELLTRSFTTRTGEVSCGKGLCICAICASGNGVNLRKITWRMINFTNNDTIYTCTKYVYWTSTATLLIHICISWLTYVNYSKGSLAHLIFLTIVNWRKSISKRCDDFEYCITENIIMITMQITKRYHRVIDYHKLLSSYIGQIPCNSSPSFCPLSPRTQIFYSSSYVSTILPHLPFVKKKVILQNSFLTRTVSHSHICQIRTSAYESTASRSHIKAYQSCNDLNMSPWLVRLLPTLSTLNKVHLFI